MNMPEMLDEAYIKETRQMFDDAKLPKSIEFYGYRDGKNKGKRPEKWEAMFLGKEIPYESDIKLYTSGIDSIPTLLDTIEDLQDWIKNAEEEHTELTQRIRELEAEADILADRLSCCHCGIDVKYLRDWAREKREEREKY